MHSEVVELLAKGGLDESTARCWFPSSTGEVFEAYAQALSHGRKLTLVGAKKSFGGHFLCPPGADALDVRDLGEPATLVEREPDGAIWVKVPAGVTFRQLLAQYPEYQPRSPPTSDGISISGALASCTHNMAGFFADGVRAFALLSPDGRSHRCSPRGNALEQALFQFAPGTFGALGVFTDIELRLERVPPDFALCIEVASCGKVREPQCYEELFRIAADPKHAPGHGLFFYGLRDRYVLVADSIASNRASRRLTEAPLTGDRPRFYAALQGLSNRHPALARHIALGAFRPGRAFSADWYGFLFFQRSYDTAYDILSSRSLTFAGLRALGVDPRLTVCHQTWCFPREHVAEFMSVYWEVMQRYAGVERRAEQQDLILLPVCRWPAHGTWGNTQGSAYITPSIAVRRGSAGHTRAAAFYSELSRVAFERNPRFKVLLLKQSTCDDGLLREMHADYVARLRELKRQVDPEQLLTSKLLSRLLVSPA
ncbi:MAG TPA: FAD-binding protein [Polyangiaceae bacterium]|nr:FAD-binding protein [Polyangiaceae bacterium]